MPASAHPTIKVNLVLNENVLAVLFLFCGMSNLYVEMHICEDDLVCCRKSGSPFDFVLPMWLL